MCVYVAAGVAGSPPVLLRAPVGVITLLPLTSVTLDCSAVGDPTPIVVWSKDSVDILALPLSPSITQVNLVYSGYDSVQSEKKCIAIVGLYYNSHISTLYLAW